VLWRENLYRVLDDLLCCCLPVRWLDTRQVQKSVVPHPRVKIVPLFVDGGFEDQLCHEDNISNMTRTQFAVATKKINKAFHRTVVERCERFPSDLRQDVRVDQAAPCRNRRWLCGAPPGR